MAKTYNTLGTVAPGDVLRANSGTAAYNGVITNVNNYRVPPMVRCTTTGAAQSVNFSTDTSIQFNGTDSYDTDAMHDPASDNTRITINTAGVYVLHAGLLISAGAGGQWSSAFRVGGTTLIGELTTEGTNVSKQLLSAVFEFTAAQYVELRTNIANTRTITRDQRTFFAATWLGQAS